MRYAFNVNVMLRHWTNNYESSKQTKWWPNQVFKNARQRRSLSRLSSCWRSRCWH